MGRIKSKLIATFVSFIFLLLLINGLFLLIHFQTVHQYQKVTETIIWAQKIPQLTADLINAYYAWVQDLKSKRKQDRYHQLHQAVRQNFDKLDPIMYRSPNAVLYPGLKHLVLGIVALCDAEIEAMHDGNFVNAAVTYHEAVRRNHYVRKNTATLILKEAEIAEQSHKKIQKVHQQSIQLGLIALLLVTIGSFVFTLIFSSKLTKPLTKLSKLSHRISAGQLDAKVPDRLLKRKDEIGILSNAFQTMIHHLQSTIKQMHRSNSDLVAAQTRLQEINLALHQNLEKLKFTQTQLVESEKMASLGGLVAGVAHEINSPLGAALMTSSHLEDIAHHFMNLYQQKGLTRTQFEAYLGKVLRSSTHLNTNLNQAAELIRHFKQVAVDQTNMNRRVFNIKHYLQKMLRGLQFQMKKPPTINLTCPDGLEINSYPGLFYQIITNLIMNSFVHGFQEGNQGAVEINIWLSNTDLVLSYCDDGCGMPIEVLKNCLEPFYTTKRNQGGTGLGLHIVYNIVVNTLKGELNFTSTPGKGVLFMIRIPIGL